MRTLPKTAFIGDGLHPGALSYDYFLASLARLWIKTAPEAPMLRSFLIPSACLALLFAAGCEPCGCEKASLETIDGIDPPDLVASFEFDDSINPFADDKFTARIRNKKDGNDTVITGTYDEDGDTIRFDPEGGKPFLENRIESGKISKLECETPRPGSFTITVAVKDSNLTSKISFRCTQR